MFILSTTKETCENITKTSFLIEWVHKNRNYCFTRGNEEHSDKMVHVQFAMNCWIDWVTRTHKFGASKSITSIDMISPHNSARLITHSILICSSLSSLCSKCVSIAEFIECNRIFNSESHCSLTWVRDSPSSQDWILRFKYEVERNSLDKLTSPRLIDFLLVFDKFFDSFCHLLILPDLNQFQQHYFVF